MNKTNLYLLVLMSITLGCQNTEHKNTEQVQQIETFQLVDDFNFNEVYPSNKSRSLTKPILLNGQQYCIRYDVKTKWGENNEAILESVNCEIGGLLVPRG